MTLSRLNLFTCALVACATVLSACDLSIMDFGASGNGVDYDDAALLAAIDKCQLGGRITFPSGKYLLSPFNITSNMELYLEEGSTLLATTDISRWPIVPPFPSYPDVRIILLDTPQFSFSEPTFNLL